MSWARFIKLLQTQPMERETKLMLINTVAGIQDPRLKQEVLGFLFDWEEWQTASQLQLLNGIKQAVEDYQHARTALERSTDKQMLHLADALVRDAHIEDLKQSIHSL